MRLAGHTLSAPRRASANQQGFTIIEALIVLAIAGLILLIVFEAIPTLERNNRNNSRKQDVSNVLQAVSHYELNNSADFPPDNTYLNFIGGNNGLRFYTTGNITRHPQTARSAGTINPSSNANTVDIYNYERCDDTTVGKATNVGAGYGDVVAIFAIETSNGTEGQCQQL